jgi:hypothetical protein|tara:strand:+ start:75 stop:377 length:303 start_codon:yes stop_codon:yes gene_type:complete
MDENHSFLFSTTCGVVLIFLFTTIKQVSIKMTKFASMTAPLVYLEKFFQIQHRMKKPGFGEVLFNRGASSDMKNFSISPSQEAEVSSLTFNYRVPAHLCR